MSSVQTNEIERNKRMKQNFKTKYLDTFYYWHDFTYNLNSKWIGSSNYSTVTTERRGSLLFGKSILLPSKNFLFLELFGDSSRGIFENGFSNPSCWWVLVQIVADDIDELFIEDILFDSLLSDVISFFSWSFERKMYIFHLGSFFDWLFGTKRTQQRWSEKHGIPWKSS